MECQTGFYGSTAIIGSTRVGKPDRKHVPTLRLKVKAVGGPVDITPAETLPSTETKVAQTTSSTSLDEISYKTELIKPGKPGGPSRTSSWPRHAGSTGATVAASTNMAVISRWSNSRLSVAQRRRPAPG
jgi:hypothetical protein